MPWGIIPTLVVGINFYLYCQLSGDAQTFLLYALTAGSGLRGVVSGRVFVGKFTTMSLESWPLVYCAAQVGEQKGQDMVTEHLLKVMAFISQNSFAVKKKRKRKGP